MPIRSSGVPPPEPVLSLYIYLTFFVLYPVNQCRVQLGTNKVVVVFPVSIHYYSTETDITHMDDSLFSIFLPIFEKVVKWGSGSFEFSGADDLRSRIFGSFSVKFLACLLLLGFSNIKKMV